MRDYDLAYHLHPISRELLPQVDENLCQLNKGWIHSISMNMRSVDDSLPKYVQVSHPSLSRLRRVFHLFDEFHFTEDHSETDFQVWTQTADGSLLITESGIHLHVLGDRSHPLIKHAIRALQFVEKLWKVQLSGLKVYCALNPQVRDWHGSVGESRIHTAAFSVSGLCMTEDNTIFVTKEQGFLKTLFHELSHYCQLDAELKKAIINSPWQSQNPYLELSEAWSETVGVLMNLAYHHQYLPTRMNHLLDLEYTYNLQLSWRIANLLGVDLREYFNGEGKQMLTEIKTAEYVYLRSVMLEHAGDILVRSNNWKITQPSLDYILDLPDLIKPKYQSTNASRHVPYVLIQFDRQYYSQIENQTNK